MKKTKLVSLIVVSILLASCGKSSDTQVEFKKPSLSDLDRTETAKPYAEIGLPVEDWIKEVDYILKKSNEVAQRNAKNASPITLDLIYKDKVLNKVMAFARAKYFDAKDELSSSISQVDRSLQSTLTTTSDYRNCMLSDYPVCKELNDSRIKAFKAHQGLIQAIQTQEKKISAAIYLAAMTTAIYHIAPNEKKMSSLDNFFRLRMEKPTESIKTVIDDNLNRALAEEMYRAVYSHFPPVWQYKGWEFSKYAPGV